MSKNFPVSDIQGFNPSVEPTRSQNIFALNGRNYVFDTVGVKSIFGNRLLLPQRLSIPQHIQGVRIRLRGGDRCFTFAAEAILEWSESDGGWDVIYTTPDTSLSPYRWTYGYLNGLVFFCHPRTGILVYDPVSGICKPHDGPGVPAEAIAITINNGFLVVIDPVFESWSQPSNGMDFTPTLGGAGFQAIGDRVPGFPIMVSSYTRGTLVWTTGGVMRSEFTGDSTVYQHRALLTTYRPINSFCVNSIDDDTVVILDERGLFRSQGEAPVAHTPVFNEYLGRYIRDNQLKEGVNVRMEWDPLESFMYISTSLSYSDPIYENCFVLYSNLDKWGQFSDKHYGILPFLIQQSSRQGDYFGYVDERGNVRYWLKTGSRESPPMTNDTNLFYPPIQKPVQYADDTPVTIMSSSGVANVVQLSGRAAYYPWDGFSPKSPTLFGLGSSLMLGLFRYDGDASSDELAEIIQITIRSPSLDKKATDGSYNINPPPTPFDFRAYETDIDSRLDLESYVNHQLKVIGTNDGEASFDSQTPSLIAVTKTKRDYACSVIGVWHILQFDAVQTGEAFNIATIEITAVSAGRLN